MGGKEVGWGRKTTVADDSKKKGSANLKSQHLEMFYREEYEKSESFPVFKF